MVELGTETFRPMFLPRQVDEKLARQSGEVRQRDQAMQAKAHFLVLQLVYCRKDGLIDNIISLKTGTAQKSEALSQPRPCLVPLSTLSTNFLTQRIPPINPLLEEFPISIIESRIIGAVSSDEKARQAATLVHRCHPRTLARWGDPALFHEDRITVFKARCRL
jgi:hypothetical protein